MTATQEILDALAICYGSATSKAFIAAIADGEGGISFNTLFGSGTLLAPTEGVSGPAGARLWTGSIATFPTWGGAQLSSGSITHAAGAAQFEPASYVAASLISGRNDFSAQSQIQNTWDFANRIFTALSGTPLHTALMADNLEAIPEYLMSTWPGGCDSDFPTRYTANFDLVTTTSALAARKVGRGIAIML